ncbi:MAG: cytochrome c [Ilumatobacteraceae bacterium]
MATQRRAVGLLAYALPVALAVGVAACGDDDEDVSSGEPPGASDAVAAGKDLARASGCTACHGVDGQGGIGPAWAGSLGTTIELTDGSTATIDEAYITQSIHDPPAHVQEGFAVAMPANELTDEQVADIVAYILSLNGASPAAGG